MIALDLKTAKKSFFDRAAVLNRITPTERRVLSKFGAFVRTRSRTSIRKRKNGSSRPGQPPLSHSKDSFASLRNILFAYDSARRSVVIGPVKINGKSSGLSVTVPHLMEYGGSSTVTSRMATAKGKQVWVKGPKRQVIYAPRPFMNPAFEIEKRDSLPALWRNAIHK